MQKNFAACLAETLKYEGGWADNPRDPGGATMRGITLSTYAQFMKRKVTEDELYDISPSVVAEIYRLRYWNIIGGDELPAGVDMLLFDICVNSGPGRAKAWYAGLGNLPHLAQIQRLDARRRSFWHALKTYVTFGRGWMARENGVLAAAMQLAKGE